MVGKILDSISPNNFDRLVCDLIHSKNVSGKAAFTEALTIVKQAGGKSPYSSYISYKNASNRKKRRK